MAEQAARARASRNQLPTINAKRPAFQEEPGEAVAVRASFLENARHSGVGVGAALASAGPITRAHAVSRMQQQHGNAYVQRLVAVQRDEDDDPTATSTTSSTMTSAMPPETMPSTSTATSTSTSAMPPDDDRI